MVNISNFLLQGEKLATRRQLSKLKIGSIVTIFYRGTKTIIGPGTIIEVPDNFKTISNMSQTDKFVVSIPETGQTIAITTRCYGLDNIAALVVKDTYKNGKTWWRQVNLIVSDETVKPTKSEIVKKLAKNNNMPVIDVPMEKPVSSSLIGIPVDSDISDAEFVTGDAEALERKKLKQGNKSAIIPASFPLVGLDMAGNFYNYEGASRFDIPMEEITRKIVACHQMSGSLDWLEKIVEAAKSNTLTPINNFHKKHMKK